MGLDQKLEEREFYLSQSIVDLQDQQRLLRELREKMNTDFSKTQIDVIIFNLDIEIERLRDQLLSIQSLLNPQAS